jgi:hypothetical protein
MNPIDRQLERLFRAASKAEADQAVTPAYGLETRVLAAWRTTPTFHFWDTRLLIRGLLIRGLIVAAAIMGISLWPMLTQHKTVNPFSDYLQLADTDSTVQLDTTP